MNTMAENKNKKIRIIIKIRTSPRVLRKMKKREKYKKK
jgi:hypothetical protein